MEPFTDGAITEFHVADIFHCNVVGPTDAHLIVIVDHGGLEVIK